MPLVFKILLRLAGFYFFGGTILFLWRKILSVFKELPIVFIFVWVWYATQLFAEPVRVGYFAVPPHVIEEDGSITGACVDFFEKKIAPQMGVTVIWSKKTMSIPRILIEFQNKRLDACLVMAKNVEREKISYYPKVSFIESGPVLALLKDHPLKEVKTLDDILNLNIGYGQGAYLSPFMRDERIKFNKISRPDWIEFNFKRLIHGRIDAFYLPERPTMLYLAKKNNAEEDIKIINLPERTKLYTIFSRNLNENLVKRYEQAFRKVDGEATYLKFLSKYININRLEADDLQKDKQ